MLIFVPKEEGKKYNSLSIEIRNTSFLHGYAYSFLNPSFIYSLHAFAKRSCCTSSNEQSLVARHNHNAHAWR